MKKLFFLLGLLFSLNSNAQNVPVFYEYDDTQGHYRMEWTNFETFAKDIIRINDTTTYFFLLDTVYLKNTPITTSIIGNWNMAFSWGNHASEGYLDVATARQSISFTQTGTIDFDLTAVSYQDSSIELIGVETGDVVSIGVPAGAVVADVTYFGWVSATDTVTIRCSRVGGGGSANPASGTFRVSVFRY